jgi:hypothetical protein
VSKSLGGKMMFKQVLLLQFLVVCSSEQIEAG